VPNVLRCARGRRRIDATVIVDVVVDAIDATIVVDVVVVEILNRGARSGNCAGYVITSATIPTTATTVAAISECRWCAYGRHQGPR
jgi:hypothetical protein